jgi:hypothetical protein
MCPEEEVSEAARELRTGRWYQVPVKNIALVRPTVAGATLGRGQLPAAGAYSTHAPLPLRLSTSARRRPIFPGTGTGSSNPSALWARVH